jgi:hypothetical protein
MSLLTVIQDSMKRINLPPATSVIGNTDDQTVPQLLSIAQDVGREMSRKYFWRILNNLGTITGDGTTTLWPLPADYGNLSPGLQFASSTRPIYMISGPITNEAINQLKAYASGPSFTVWRLIGNNVEFWPAIGNGEIITFSYYSANWIMPLSGANIAIYQADTDVALMDEYAQTDGVIARWLEVKGLEYAEASRRYQASLDAAIGRDNTTRTVGMSFARPISWTTWPGTITDLTTQNY